MSSSIKAGGAWKSITGISTKVAGDWKTVSAAYTKVAGVWKQWYAPVIIDNFNRSTSGTLGTSTSGAGWSNVRGSWYANGSSGQSSDAATGYPLATVGFGNVDFEASIGVSNGVGLAFWIADANNWYAAYAYQTTTSTTENCNPYSCAPCYPYNCQTVNPTYPNCSPCTVNTYATSTTYKCPNYDKSGYSCTGPINLFNDVCPAGYTQTNTSPCTGQTSPVNYAYCYKTTTTSTATSFCNGSSSTSSGPCCDGSTIVTSTVTDVAGTAGSCNSCQSCDTICSTCYESCTVTTNTWKLKLIKMTNNVPTVVGTEVTLTATPAAIKVDSSGGVISVYAYSNAAMTTQMGTTLTHTPATSGPGQYIGIVKAPSDSQGSTADNLLISL